MASYRGYSWEEFQVLPAPVGGWNPDVPPSELPENQAQVLDNFIVRAGEVVPRGSIQKVAAWATTPGNPMAYTGIQPVPGDTRLLAGQKTPGGNPSTAGVDPWTAPIMRPAASAALATADTRYALQDVVGSGHTNATGTRDSAPGWRGVNFQGKRYYISYDSAGAAVQDPGSTYFMRPLSLCQVDTAGTLTVLTLAPHGASDVRSYQSRIWLAGGIDTPAAGTTYDPTKIFFTIPGTTNALGSATADWRDPISGATNFIKLDGNYADPLTGLATYRNTMLFFRYGSIYALRGTDTSNYIAQPVTREMGVFDPRSIVESDSGVFFLSRRGLMLTDGNVVRNVSGPVMRTLQQAVAIVLGSIKAGWGGSATCAIASQGQIIVSLSIPNITSAVLDGKMVPIWSAMFDPSNGTWVRLTSALWFAATSNNYYAGILMNTPDRRLLALDDTAIYQLESEAVVGLTTTSVTNFPTSAGNDVSYGGSGNTWLNASRVLTNNGSYATGSPSSSGTGAGPNLAGAGADNAGIGTVAWAFNPGNITAEDGNRTTTANLTTGQVTHYLVSSSHGFAIPSPAVIQGIMPEVKRHASATNIIDKSVVLLKAGALQAANMADLVTGWPTTLTWKTYGGPQVMWGTTWTPADINNTGFGLAISCQLPTSNLIQPGIDAIRITIFYSQATNYLSANTFGFAVPTNSVIAGIQVARFGKDGVGSFNGVDASMRLSQGGSVSGSDLADLVTVWGGSDFTATYGGATNLWGLTWTPAQINASGFGVNYAGIAIAGHLTLPAFAVDYFTVTVYYQLAAATALQSFVQTPALYDQQDSTHWLAIPLLWVTRLAPAGQGRRMVQLKRFFLDFVMQASAPAVTAGWAVTAIDGTQAAFGPTLTTPIGGGFIASSIVGAPNISAAGVQRQNQDQPFEADDLAFRVAFTDAVVRSSSPDPIDARLYDIGVELRKTRDTTG